jgi:hypothetical protein
MDNAKGNLMALTSYDQLTVDNARALAALASVDDILAYEAAKGKISIPSGADESATCYAIAFGRAAATISQLTALIEHLTGETT